jgi:delta8-fatty-acid desaturase
MRDEILSRNEIEARIAEGELIVVHSDKALRLNGWIERHPGGDKAIFHMVGRDATDQINV